MTRTNFYLDSTSQFRRIRKNSDTHKGQRYYGYSRYFFVLLERSRVVA